MSEVYTPSDEELRELYGSIRTIAVVGMSGKPHKAAHTVPRYLKEMGYRIRPVNPNGGEIIGIPVATSLAEVGEPIDVVDVFRPAEETPDVARAAVAAGAKVLWLQEGIYSDEARQIAEDAGLLVVMGRCMGQTHYALGLGPGPEQGEL